LPYAFYHRLSAARRRIYRRSDAIESVELSPEASFGALAADLEAALESESRVAVAAACQTLADQLTESLRIDPLEIVVHLARPRNTRSELHGLYEPGTLPQKARISVWMRTAKRRQVVAFRTFLRTFLHEICHHLDYELYGLPESFHTQGFYKRESSLFRQIVDARQE
jgi:hypothetical protein